MKGTKDNLYVVQQREILLKMLKEIGISKGRVIIKRDDLNSEETRNKIKLMKDEIWRYYKTNSWNSCRYGKDLELNIIKNVCKYHNIKIYKLEKKRNDGDKIKSYKVYEFNIEDELLSEL